MRKGAPHPTWASARGAIAGADQPERFHRNAWGRAAETSRHRFAHRLPWMDEEVIRVNRTLMQAGSAASLEGVALDPEIRAALEEAAPVFRPAWAQQDAANREWVQKVLPLVH